MAQKTSDAKLSVGNIYSIESEILSTFLIYIEPSYIFADVEKTWNSIHIHILGLVWKKFMEIK